MVISYLADTFDLAEQLIPGLLQHWRFLMPDDTHEARGQRLRLHMNRGALPIAWLAHEGGRAMGTAALRATDLPGREDLGPWLGGVYVAPDFRGRGIASALCRTVESRAAELGFRKLYLFTLDQQRLYERLGWRIAEPATWKGRATDLIMKELGPG
jgi:GNAT superfamily N-acetyltransferase